MPPFFLDRDEIIRRLEHDHGLSGNHVYLLNVIPLVEMMWADGKNQAEEIHMIESYIVQRLAMLGNAADGEDVISQDEVDMFLQRFVYAQPPAEMLHSLHELACIEINRQEGEQGESMKDDIINQCVNIAAATVPSYPYPRGGRICGQEKQVLMQWIRDLHMGQSSSFGNDS